jgi:hypothetical protein
VLSGGTWPLEPDDEEEEELLLELLELLEELELLETPLEEDEELLTTPVEDEDEDDELLLELEEGFPLFPSSGSPPQATKVSANKSELAIVTGRCQPTNVFIEDIFTYLFLVTHIVS